MLQEAITLNNEGVHLFLSGNYLQASHFIHQAFATMTNATAGTTEIWRRKTPSSRGAMSAAKQSPETCSIEEATRPHFVKETDALYVHFRPLLIPQHLPNEGDHDGRQIDIAFSYLAFNLGLACHQSGVTSGSEAMWKRARDLYCVVLNSQHQLVGMGLESNSQGALIQCLALNNLAHIHYEFCEYEFSEQYLVFMMNIHEHTECLDMSDDDSENILSQWEMEEITLNVVYAKSPPMAASA